MRILTPHSSLSSSVAKMMMILRSVMRLFSGFLFMLGTLSFLLVFTSIVDPHYFDEQIERVELAKKTMTLHADHGVYATTMDKVRTLTVKYDKAQANCREFTTGLERNKNILTVTRQRENNARLSYESMKQNLLVRESLLKELYQSYRQNCELTKKWKTIAHTIFDDNEEEDDQLKVWLSRFQNVCDVHMKVWENFDDAVDESQSLEKTRYEAYVESKEKTNEQEGNVIYAQKNYEKHCRSEKELKAALIPMDDWLTMLISGN